MVYNGVRNGSRSDEAELEELDQVIGYQLIDSELRIMKILVNQLVVEMQDKDQRIAVLENEIANMRGTL